MKIMLSLDGGPRLAIVVPMLTSAATVLFVSLDHHVGLAEAVQLAVTICYGQFLAYTAGTRS